MRRAIATLFTVALIVGLAAPAANAAVPSTAKLAAQVKSLQKQVTALKKQVKKMNTALVQTEGLAIVAFLYGGCNTAVTADEFQANNPAAFGTTPVNDYNACSDLSKFTNVAITRSNTSPGNTNVFQQLLTIFK
jgi:hypothetical protein